MNRKGTIMINKLSEASTVLQDCIKSLKDLYIKADPDDDKPIFSRVIEKLNKVDNMLSSIEVNDNKSTDNTWNIIATEYKSFNLESLCTVMISKKSRKSPYTKEWYCKDCFDKHIKSQLKPQKGLVEYICPNSERHSICITDHEWEIIRQLNKIPLNPPRKKTRMKIVIR
jgi:hypothetical protein